MTTADTTLLKLFLKLLLSRSIIAHSQISAGIRRISNSFPPMFKKSKAVSILGKGLSRFYPGIYLPPMLPFYIPCFFTEKNLVSVLN